MKKGFILTPFIVSLVLVVAGFFVYENNKEPIKEALTFGAPTNSVRYERELTPEADSKYYLGTSSPSLKAWRGLIVDEICLDSDCKTAWPTGGGGSGGGTWATTTSQVSGQNINYSLETDDIVVIGSNASTTGEFYYDPNVFNLFVKSASSTIAGPLDIVGNFKLPLLSNGGLGVFGGLVSSGATTTAGTGLTYSGNAFNVNTSQNITNLSNLTSNGLVYTAGGDGTLNVIASSSLNVGTATALAANGGNCSAGNAPLGVDASGAVESCFDVWTEAENTSAGYIDGTGVTNALVGFVDSNTVQATGTTHSLYVPSIFASTTNLNTFKGDVEVGTENGGPYLETAGADASPPFAFRNDRDTGMYSAGANALGFATGGTNRLTISSTGNLTFGYSSSTAYSSFEHASTTNFTFGGVTADTWPEFCTTITGSADLCDGSDASGAGGSSAYEIATTSDIAVPQVAYFTKTGGRTTLGSIATGTISVPTGLTITANRYALGGSAAIGLDTGYVIPLQSTLDGKEDDLTFNWPLTRSTNTISWGGLSTTTNLTVGHIPFVSGVNTFSSRATTSASCAGSVSCTGFDILGSSPITITGTDSTASTTLLGDTNSWSGVNRFSLASTTYHSFTTASTTNLNIGGDTFIDLTGTGLAVSGGVLNTSNIPNASLANSTISGIALGSNLNSLSNDATLNGSSYNGSSAISDWGLNLANANNWTALQTFLNASSTLFSARQAYFGGSATTTIGLDGSIVIPSGSNLTITGKSDGCATFASGVLNSTGSACGSGGGITALGSGYASTTGTAITFSTSTLSFNGLTVGQTIVPTAGALTFTPNITGTLNNTGLTNSTISGIALGSNLADLTATNGTLTFSGTYNGGTARTIGLNLANANTWTAKQDFFGAASSTLFSANWGAFGATGTTTINTLGQLLVGTTTPWLNSMANFVGTTTVKGQLVSLAASTTANTTQTIDWSSGNTQKIMLTGNTSIVVNSTSSNPIDGGKYTLRICQDPTGSRTLTWANPISLRWWNGTTTITSTANKCTMIGMVYTAENGNNIYSIVASSTNIDIK